MTETVYVAFGSNMGDGEENIKKAITALEGVPGIEVDAVSDLFITRPWGYEAQDNFCNACARLKVSLSPEAILGVCLGIESAMGRKREIKNGPRIIDIDVIIYIGQTRNSDELILPHPRMSERDFVLVPLVQVAEDNIKNELTDMLNRLKEKYIVE